MRFPGKPVLVIALVAGLATPAAATQAGYPFQDTALPVAARVADLLGRLTLDEKIALLHQYQPAVPRLGIARVQGRHRGAARRRLVQRRERTTATW